MQLRFLDFFLPKAKLRREFIGGIQKQNTGKVLLSKLTLKNQVLPFYKEQ